MVHYRQQFCQHPVLRHLLQGDELRANKRPCLLYEFVQSVGILRLDSCTLVHHSQEDGAQNNRLIEHLEHPVAGIKGPVPPQEVKPAQVLLVDCLRVCFIIFLPGPLSYCTYRGPEWSCIEQSLIIKKQPHKLIVAVEISTAAMDG